MESWRVTASTLRKAREMAKGMKINTRESILKGKGLLAGCIGKIIIRDLLKKHFDNVTLTNSKNILVENKYIGIRVKQRSVPPRENFNCSVTTESLNSRYSKKFDYFCFGQVNEDLTQFWILGFITQERFIEEGFILHKGERDGSYVVKKTCRNIKIGDLDPKLILL